MRVPGFWQSWLLPLILVLTLAGTARGLGAQSAAPEPAWSAAPGEVVVPEMPAPPSLEAPRLEPPAEAPAAVAMPPAGQADFTLRTLRIEGAKIVKVSQIKKELSLKPPPFWAPWSKPPPFRFQDLEYDIERLKLFYRRQGFFTPRSSLKSTTARVGPWL